MAETKKINIDHISNDEMYKLLRCINNPKHLLTVALLLNGLSVKDIIGERGILAVRNPFKQKGRYYYTKLADGRKIRLDEVAISLLVKYPKNPPVYDNKYIVRIVKTYGEVAGIGNFLTPTILRYTWAVNAVREGSKNKFIQNQMGIYDRHKLSAIRRKAKSMNS